MDDVEKQIRLKLKNNFAHYASKCLKIRTKSGKIYPFALNKAQLHIHQQVEQQKAATGKVRALILKGRQQGCSTYIEGRFYWLVTHHFGLRAFILTHDVEATNNLFEMAQRYHENCPAIVRPSIEASNAKELIFAGLDSGYKLGTAGNKAVGRSSTIQLFHGSEAAYWPHATEHAKGILQAVSNERGTEIFIESTANGLGNYFHQQWQLAETHQSEFLAIFVPWYWQDEYQHTPSEDFIATDEELELQSYYGLSAKQIYWRRLKIIELSVSGMDGAKAFMQEYPCTAAEAFQTTGENCYIVPNLVIQARKTKAEAIGPLLIGVDPARFGDDRTSIIRRKGRVAYNLQSYTKKDTMEVTGLVHQIIINERPHKVFVDIVGLGAGVFDRLKELGHGKILVAVSSGATPRNQDRFINKRAEMWCEMREWLADAPVQIPDSDTLHADLCGIRYSNDSKNRLVMEKKEDMKKRGIRSSDEADALVLTFALPGTALNRLNEAEDNELAHNFMSSFKQIDRLKKKAYSR